MHLLVNSVLFLRILKSANSVLIIIATAMFLKVLTINFLIFNFFTLFF